MNVATRKLLRPGLGVAMALILLSGCATMRENDMVSEAQQEVERAQQNPAVARYAALKLQEAENSLRRAETLWEEQGTDSIEEVEHHAYLAKQQAGTAMQQGVLGEAEAEVQQASQQREQILREAREQELQTALQRAERAERQAEMAQDQGRPEPQQEQEALSELRQTVEDLQAQQTARGTVLTLPNVLFNFGEADLNPGGERSISQLAAYLEENPDRRLLVEGYTDSVGDPAFNEGLSEQRAEAVREQLITAGIDAERIEVVGHGENYPVASNDTPYGRQLNRRVEVVVAPGPGEQPQPRTQSPQEEGTAAEPAQQGQQGN